MSGRSERAQGEDGDIKFEQISVPLSGTWRCGPDECEHEAGLDHIQLSTCEAVIRDKYVLRDE